MRQVTIDPDDERVMVWVARRFGTGATSVRTVMSQLADFAESPAEPEGTGAVIVDKNAKTWVSAASHSERWRGDYLGDHAALNWLDLKHPVTVLHEGYTPEAEL